MIFLGDSMKLFGWFDPTDVRGGLWRLIVIALLSMTTLRAIINPTAVVFRADEVGNADYLSMIAMSALLIAIDAMLIVLLSWSHLRDWKDALGVAALVGMTHVFFPLITFAVTAGAALGAQSLGLPAVFAAGIQTAIYFVAFAFVASHLWKVHVATRETDVDRFEPDVSVATWTGVKKIWPIVFAVSIDALMVGPAKVAFMARYSLVQFGFSFLLVGAMVFVLVSGSGLIVLLLKAVVQHHAGITAKVHHIDWMGSLALLAVFIHFSIFALVYVLYTFVEVEWLLYTQVIWGTTVVLFLMYLRFGKIGDIRKASRQRAGLV
jgi:hypothetical protein